MGLFNLFKPKNQVQVTTDLGVFTMRSGKTQPIWSTLKDNKLLSVHGTLTEPAPEQLSFIKKLDNELEKLDAAITVKFIELFSENSLPVEFTHWNQRFVLTAVMVESIIKDKVSWNITFEDIQNGFAHFNLYIKDNNLTDFSIDT